MGTVRGPRYAQSLSLVKQDGLAKLRVLGPPPRRVQVRHSFCFGSVARARSSELPSSPALALRQSSYVGPERLQVQTSSGLLSSAPEEVVVESAAQLRLHVGVDQSGGSELWASNPVQHDVGVTLLVLVGAWAWVRVFDYLTDQNFLGQKLSRKLVHISSGLLFASCWPLYSALPWAQYLAALVPVSNGLRLLVYGLGFLKDDGLVKSVSREGDPRELLRGPLYYVVVVVLSTILFWRKSPVGVLALGMMCGGDGVADIVGRRFGGRYKLPYNPAKSWAGSVAMFSFGVLISYACLWYFSLMGFYRLETGATLLIRLAAVSFAATVVESLPISTKLDDNVTVPLTAVVMGMLLFPAPRGNLVFGLSHVNLN